MILLFGEMRYLVDIAVVYGEIRMSLPDDQDLPRREEMSVPGVAAAGDQVLAVLSKLVPGGVRLGELRRDEHVLRWPESGSGSPAVVLDAALGNPGTLEWAGVMPLVAPRTRVVAYDRAGLGASDPASPPTLQAQVDDLVAVVGKPAGAVSWRGTAGAACCYAQRSQARAVADEKRLIFESLPVIRRARAAAALPAVPVVIFSATTGRPQDERQEWTSRHARLAASVPSGEHIVLADTNHYVNHERPAEIAQAINKIIDAARQL